MSKVTSKLRLYLKATTLKQNLIQMKYERMSDFINYVGKRLRGGVIRNHIKYSPNTIPTINSAQIEKKEPRVKSGSSGWRASKIKVI